MDITLKCEDMLGGQLRCTDVPTRFWNLEEVYISWGVSITIIWQKTEPGILGHWKCLSANSSAVSRRILMILGTVRVLGLESNLANSDSPSVLVQFESVMTINFIHTKRKHFTSVAFATHCQGSCLVSYQTDVTRLPKSDLTCHACGWRQIDKMHDVMHVGGRVGHDVSYQPDVHDVMLHR